MTEAEFLLAILVGVVGNAASTFLSYGFTRVKQVTRDALGPPSLLEVSDLKAALTDGIDGLAQVASFGSERVTEFLQSREVDLMVRQIFSNNVLDECDTSYLESISDHFVRTLSMYTQESIENVQACGRILFKNLVKCCERALDIAISRNSLSSHEAKSALRFNVLRDMISSVRERQEFLLSREVPCLPDVLQFEREYRLVLSRECGTISPPHLDKQRLVPIDHLYVDPEFRRARRNDPSDTARLKTAFLVSSVYRCVILGDPGGGKSTFARKLCHDLAKGTVSVAFGCSGLTPILVTLRNYEKLKKRQGCSIVEFLEWTAKSDLQLSVPKGAFDYLLRNGRAAVIFDGLDELLETSDRQRVSRDVEAFATRYPGVPIIVTSRVVGYDQAPLDDSEFDVFRLDSFNDRQVASYAHKWFIHGAGLAQDEGTSRATAFLRESAGVPDLRSNPLMLALMCNLYFGENYIPPKIGPNSIRNVQRCSSNDGTRVGVSTFRPHLKTTWSPHYSI